jgi:hypothetical protein
MAAPHTKKQPVKEAFQQQPSAAKKQTSEVFIRACRPERLHRRAMTSY